MKRAFILFWHGLTAIFAGIAEWFTVILGMRDDSKYGRFIRRVVGTCFSLIVIMLTSAVIYGVGKAFYEELPYNVRCSNDYYESEYISRFVTYYTTYDEDNYLKTSDGKKTITGIKWIARPLGMDSLVCYSDGKKRGYFNMFTGKPVIEPQYDHAWIFSDGLASVDDDGWIKFIDATGKVVIDPKIPYVPYADGYVFHDGRCIIHNERRDRFGLIDRQGKWVLKPEYTSIKSWKNLWVINNGEEESVLDSTMNTVIPFMKGDIEVYDEYITVILSDHTIRRYSHSGELINDFYINGVEQMTYETGEIRYTKTKTYEEDGTLVTEKEDDTKYNVEKTAVCRRYEAESGWYGLITAGGKVVTPPSYTAITAIGHDLYLCEKGCDGGVILNGKGEMVR